MSIRFKLLAGSLALVSVTVFMGVFGWMETRAMSNIAATIYDKTFTGIYFAGQAQSAFLHFAASHQTVDSPIDDAASKKLLKQTSDKLEITVDRAATAKAREAAGALLAKVRSLTAPESVPQVQRLAEIDKDFARLLSRYAADALIYRAEADAMAERSEKLLVISMTVAVLLSSLGAFIFAARLTRPIQQVTSWVTRLAAKDYRCQLAHQSRRDEIGEMVRAVEILREAGVAHERLEAEAAASRQIALKEREDNEARRQAQAKEQSQVVAGLASGLAGLSAGDLAQRLDHPFAADYEGLRADFNAALTQLQESVTQVSAGTSNIRSGVDEIASASDDLARRTEHQAASLEETAAALDQITVTVKKTADGARHAQETVAAARTGAQHSGEVVDRAVAAMARIEESSQKIGQIIGVIDEIAFQTNLLALNAGVEAARAGEAGRGFAVVASEVRALAQRSAEAAKEIKALIMTSDEQVKAGVQSVGETGKSLTKIVGQVISINDIVSAIAASAQEQASGLAQVNTAINQMDQMTQQNAAMVEQSTASAHSLTGETEKLMELVGRFRLGGTSLQSPIRAPLRAIATREPAVRSSKAMGRAVLAGNRHSATAEETWKEF